MAAGRNWKVWGKLIGAYVHDREPSEEQALTIIIQWCYT
jgi:hypothetical protein